MRPIDFSNSGALGLDFGTANSAIAALQPGSDGGAHRARSFDRRTPRRVVVGRPVHFSNAQNHEDDEFALGRLRDAVTPDDIIGTDGVAVAGDAFDKQIIRKLVAPRLGLGSEYFSPPNKFLPIPSWPCERLERWHHLSFLNTAKNLEMLEQLRRSAIIPERLEAFLHLYQERNGVQAA